MLPVGKDPWCTDHMFMCLLNGLKNASYLLCLCTQSYQCKISNNAFEMRIPLGLCLLIPWHRCCLT